MIIRFTVGLVLLFALTACSSAPTHFYTLMPIDEKDTYAGEASFDFQLLTLRVPVQVDQSQIVIRDTDTLQILENERWAAPLADELHDALDYQLERQLGRPDTSRLALTPGKPRVEVQIEVRRFESVPGQYALIQAAWSLRSHLTNDVPSSLICVSTIRQEAGTSLNSLVQAHQRAIEILATRMAHTTER